jgi:hypothetical protein
MLGVPADDIPKDISALFKAAAKDFARGSDEPDWSPFSLPEPLSTALLVYKVQNMIDNENLDFFFENDWPTNPPYSVFSDAFRKVGATEVADCIDDAVSMFPSLSPHLDYEMRRSFMEDQEKKSGGEGSPIQKLGWRITALGRETMLQLASYIRRHIEHFPSAKKIA